MLSDHEPGSPLVQDSSRPTADELTRCRLVSINLISAVLRRDYASVYALTPRSAGEAAYVSTALAEVAADLIAATDHDPAEVINALRGSAIRHQLTGGRPEPAHPHRRPVTMRVHRPGCLAPLERPPRGRHPEGRCPTCRPASRRRRRRRAVEETPSTRLDVASVTAGLGVKRGCGRVVGIAGLIEMAGRRAADGRARCRAADHVDGPARWCRSSGGHLVAGTG